jgi:hypothetical protein
MLKATIMKTLRRLQQELSAGERTSTARGNYLLTWRVFRRARRYLVASGKRYSPLGVCERYQDEIT